MTQEPIKDPEDLGINIVNVVASASLDQKINLIDIIKENFEKPPFGCPRIYTLYKERSLLNRIL